MLSNLIKCTYKMVFDNIEHKHYVPVTMVMEAK